MGGKVDLNVKETNFGTEFNTPALRTGFTVLREPSTKFKEQGEYSVKLQFKVDSPEGQAIIDFLNEKMDEAEAEAKAKSGRKKVKVAEPPYKMVEDEEGEPTGEATIKFTMLHRNKTKEGTEYFKTPALFTADGQPLPEDVKVGSGSLVIVRGVARTYYVSEQTGAGVSLKLQAVQVLEAKSGGVASFEKSGFSVVEGYSTASASKDTEPDEGGEDDGQSDF